MLFFKIKKYIYINFHYRIKSVFHLNLHLNHVQFFVYVFQSYPLIIPFVVEKMGSLTCCICQWGYLDYLINIYLPLQSINKLSYLIFASYVGFHQFQYIALCYQLTFLNQCFSLFHNNLLLDQRRMVYYTWCLDIHWINELQLIYFEVLAFTDLDHLEKGS